MQTKDVIDNVRKIIQCAGDARVYAVVKADGYGTGCKNLVLACAQGGIKHFAVTNEAEVYEIVDSGVMFEEILYLPSIINNEQLARLLKINVTFTVASIEDANRLSSIGQSMGIRPNAHIKIDTGMGRRGILSEQIDTVVSLYKNYKSISFSGIYTHFCNGRDAAKTRRQYKKFTALLHELHGRGIDPGIRHCCNSVAMFFHEDMIMDAVRVGSALFGRIEQADKFGLIHTGYCETDIEAIRTPPKGSTVGYSACFKIKHDTTVALCPIGCRHGFGVTQGCGKQTLSANIADTLRFLYHSLTGKNTLFATIGNKRCPVLGVVGSENVVLDVTGVECCPGDTAVFNINPILLCGMDVVWK